MKIISFGWTWHALLAQPPLNKICTRRKWKDEYARRFKAGEKCLAYDRSPRYRGKPVGIVRLTEAPYKEALIDMPEEDYFAEGFAYLAMHPEKLPKTMPYDVSREGFKTWKTGGGAMWVVRFEFIEGKVEVGA